MRNPSLVIIGAAAGIALALAATEPRLVFTGADATPASGTKKYQLLELFGAAFERVRTSYVEKPDDTKLVNSAINGMLSSLENSSFMDANSFQVRVCTGSGCPPTFGGVGIEIAMADGLAQVVSPIDGSPAAKAGIMARDVVAEIDGDPIQGLPLYEILDKLRGPRGKQIRLKIARPGRDKPIEMTFVRDDVTLQSVRARAEGSDIGYVRVNQFHEGTADELKSAIDEIAVQIAPERLKGYVLDLRNNPGGLLDQAVLVADAFLEAGDIVSIRGRKASVNEHFQAKPGDLTSGKPVIVLINAGSAAAAEIVAGALKDNHRATLVGTRSFGKGSFSSVLPIGHGLGALRLTTGHYFTPAGRAITGNGILPDVEVRQDIPDQLKTDAKSVDQGQAAFQSYIPPDAKADKALALAFDLLRGTKTAH
jgi:carboxyl-terminal processing protease